MMNTTTQYTRRLLAHFVIEAETPLAVGSGEKDITTDRLVARDFNGLPYIPATSIAGVVRSVVKEAIPNKDFFGFQARKEGHGSEIIFTDAQILNTKGQVMDGLKTSDVWAEDALLKEYAELPIRQHVRLGANGATENTGKFDEQVVFAGTRFCFEMEVVAKADEAYEKDFNTVLNALYDATFRIGGGTRKGFGAIQVIEEQSCVLDLTKPEELSRYLQKSSSLEDTSFWTFAQTRKEKKAAEGWTKYELSLTPRDFMLFGSGFGDEDADMTPVREQKVIWKDGRGCLSEEWVLIPATSVKGALAHRIAFYWNKDHGYFAGNPEAKTASECPAVHDLFGTSKDIEGKIQRGNILFSDVLVKEGTQDKIQNHVSIDCLTGGAADGALFSEKVSYAQGVHIVMTIYMHTNHVKEENILLFEKVLDDLCSGLLPLGGGTNRGNGFFNGSWIKK